VPPPSVLQVAQMPVSERAVIEREAEPMAHFRPRRHRMAASRHRAARATTFIMWQQETCAPGGLILPTLLDLTTSRLQPVNVTMPSEEIPALDH
jgi:hypothetical protein